MEEEDDNVVNIKIRDTKNGDVAFEGHVSTAIDANVLLHLGCFLERGLSSISVDQEQMDHVKSFKGLHNAELYAKGFGSIESFSGVLFVGADDGVWRRSSEIPSRDCVMLSVWSVSHEQRVKAFSHEKLELLEMMNLQRLEFDGLSELTVVPERVYCQRS